MCILDVDPYVMAINLTSSGINWKPKLLGTPMRDFQLITFEVEDPPEIYKT